MPHVPGLRSPYAQVGGLVYFGRMLDKIRLHAAGQLPADYVANLGRAFDQRCCGFLGVDYTELRDQTLAGQRSDAQLLAWCATRGGPRHERQLEVWNGFMMKRGWRDDAAEVLARRIAESGLDGRPILTMFDYLDADEGRDAAATRAWELRPPVAVVLMGVSGCGKTTIGSRLAAELGWSFRDADAFHPPANIAKMSAGTPLTDADRAPWLAAIRAHLETALARGESAVVTCSALRASYRAAALPAEGRVQLVHLAGDYDLIHARMQSRQGHFMKPEMLRSQFATLEAPSDALTLDIRRPPEELVAEIRRALGT